MRGDVTQWPFHGSVWIGKILEDTLTSILHCCSGVCILLPSGSMITIEPAADDVKVMTDF